MGETGYSGRNLGLDEKGKDGKSRCIPERFPGENQGMFQIREQG